MKWIGKEVEILKKHFPNSPKSIILKLIPNRIWHSIFTKARRLGLKREIKEYKRSWTIEKDELLKKVYNKDFISKIKLFFPNRTIQAIQHRAVRLGLKKSKSETAKKLWKNPLFRDKMFKSREKNENFQ